MTRKRHIAPSKTEPKVSDAFLLLSQGLIPEKGGETESLSCRAPLDIFERVQSLSKGTRLNRSDVAVRLIAIALEALDEAAPYAVLMAWDAQISHTTAARALVRNAIEQLVAKHPDMAKQIPSKPKK
jgi:hypothetical protein